MVNKILENLNYEQRQAVKYNDGPLFIIAGAGTGKTMTLTSKVAYLIASGVAPQRILTLTFTNKAAREMKERILNMVGPAANMSWISTFHAFGLRFLRRHISLLENGLDEGFVVIDEDDAKKIIRDLIKELGIDEKTFPSTDAYNQVSALKVGYERFYLKSEDLQRLLAKYQEYLIDNNLVDFDDLILYTLQILSKEATIRLHYQEQFEYVLVDEFQDTDHLQYEILKLLSDDKIKKNICVVGDPDQSIYSFRGARYENNHDFIKDYQAKVITLSKNYRSTNKILSLANKLIKENLDRYPNYSEKHLESDLGSGYAPVFRKFSRDIDEVIYVAEKITELTQFDGYKPNEIAILYRSNYLSRVFEETFIRYQIPYVVYGGVSFFQRREIKDIMAYVRLSLNHNQDFFLKRIINVPKRKIGDVTVQRLEEYARYIGESVFEAIPSFEIAAGTKRELDNFYAMINKFSEAIDKNIDLSDLIDLILNGSGYKEMLLAEGDQGIDRIQNILELRGVFKRGEFLYEGNTKEKLTQILDEISLMTDADKNVATQDKVILSTYHQVKGLEFKAIFMVAMEEDIFPNANAIYSKGGLEEERRIAYVGITRAKRHLFLTHSETRFRFGRKEYNRPSRFYLEIIDTFGTVKPSYLGGGTIEFETVSSFSIGDKVDHQIFGQGKIVAIEGEVAVIAFSAEHGIKKIILGHPSLKKSK